MIRVTHLLDAGTVESLECLARTWCVSKSEALRRAIRIAAQQLEREQGSAIDMLDRLQSSVKISGAQAGQWVAHVRAVRRAGP